MLLYIQRYNYIYLKKHHWSESIAFHTRINVLFSSSLEIMKKTDNIVLDLFYYYLYVLNEAVFLLYHFDFEIQFDLCTLFLIFSFLFYLI